MNCYYCVISTSLSDESLGTYTVIIVLFSTSLGGESPYQIDQ